MQIKLREIRKQLRLAMNGVVSASMREKGMEYKLNFGVSFPKIREIACTHEKDAALAEALWQENVREMKILATLLQPADSFTPEQAGRWLRTVSNQEITEFYCFNLLQELPYAPGLAIDWITCEEELFVLTGFLLFARLCMKGIRFPEEQTAVFLREAVANLNTGNFRIRQAALLALKRYGRQTPEQASGVLSVIKDYKTSDQAERKEIYDDIFFELEYYL